VGIRSPDPSLKLEKEIGKGGLALWAGIFSSILLTYLEGNYVNGTLRFCAATKLEIRVTVVKSQTKV